MKMAEKKNAGWQFIDDNASFKWDNPGPINELYFPLCNEKGIMSSITPALHGDIKTGHNNFLMMPVSMMDLHNSRAARNFWLHIEEQGSWSAVGNSLIQKSEVFENDNNVFRSLEAGFLWHKLTYKDLKIGIESEVLSFVPLEDNVEIMKVKIKNISETSLSFTPTSVIPMYGRSAENLRDHRHVTSLLNRLRLYPEGISMKPNIIFDETGHRFNNTSYFVLGTDGDSRLPEGFFVDIEKFIGDGGSLEWPEAVVKNQPAGNIDETSLEGREYVAALRFQKQTLKKGASKDYILIIGIGDEKNNLSDIMKKYNTSVKVEEVLNTTKEFWNKKAELISFQSGLKDFSNWMKWVSIQPVFRKLFGNSFLPYHDYGKGGRGWRDLWQDLLSLLLFNPENVRDFLVNNFGGIRIDGTNATIIGNAPGEFIADRNNIARVWMDHGSWPYLTTRLYIDQTGDFDMLFEKQAYFRDAQIRRAADRDDKWIFSDGTLLKAKSGNVYKGSVLEHLLVQHLISFFNVGEHNIIRLEDADWNDAIDQASDRGESVAFTAFYGGNLLDISNLLLTIKEKKGIKTIDVFEELIVLLDSINSTDNYDSIEYKKKKLEEYFNKTAAGLSGEKVSLNIDDLASDLRRKGEWIFNNIKSEQWIKTKDGHGFFNSYYNNDGERVDGEFDGGVIINLTGQVFPLMSGLADEEKIKKVYESCKDYLKDPGNGGYRLNTPLQDNKLNFGRVFAFAYGEKENGATFSHMVVMFLNALYKRGFVNEGYEVFKSLYDLSMDTEKAKIYPGIPEYFSPDGKGLYTYLTGSASWLILTVLQDMYGIRGSLGDLIIQPKLVSEQFDDQNMASVNTVFDSKDLNVRYINKQNLSYNEYKITDLIINGKQSNSYISDNKTIIIPKEEFKKLTISEKINTFDIILDLL